jgi:hypothetical protein
MNGEQRKTNIAIMAQWIADYRRTMSPEERAALRYHLKSDAGRQMLQQARGQYLEQDAYYRATSTPVIQELMTTVAEMQEP